MHDVTFHFWEMIYKETYVVFCYSPFRSSIVGVNINRDLNYPTGAYIILYKSFILCEDLVIV